MTENKTQYLSAPGTLRSLLGRYLRPQWPRFAAMCLLVLGSIALRLVNPQLLRYFIDTALAGTGSSTTLALAAGTFIGFALLNQVLLVGATYLGEDVGWTATNRLRAELADHCLRLDMSFHKRYRPGELVERIDGDVTLLANFFAQFTVQMVGNTVLLIGVILLLFREDWRVGLAITAVACLNVLVVSRIQKVAVPRWRAAREASAGLFGLIEEQLAGLEDVQANGASRFVLRRLWQRLHVYCDRFRRARLINESVFVISLALFFLGDSVSLGTSVYLHLAGVFSVGTVYLVFNYGGLVFGPLEDLQEQLQDLQKAVAGIARVNELRTTDGRLESGGDGLLPAGALPVAFQAVSFGYDEQRVLHDVTFQVAGGQTVGILGRTGSGKTTLTRLLLRFYDPDRGRVLLGADDGLRDIRSLKLSLLRERVGMVTQDVQIFEASVRDNLAFFNPHVTDQAILEALSELDLMRWFDALPDGLDTRLNGNQGLSAGEAQLLAFTRVFLKDSGVVILDEASSRLDPATERLLERAIDRLLHGRTGIIIAHRLATVQRADLIMIVDNGRVLEFGRRRRLAEDPDSYFSQLMRTGLDAFLA